MAHLWPCPIKCQMRLLVCCDRFSVRLVIPSLTAFLLFVSPSRVPFPFLLASAEPSSSPDQSSSRASASACNLLAKYLSHHCSNQRHPPYRQNALVVLDTSRFHTRICPFSIVDAHKNWNLSCVFHSICQRFLVFTCKHTLIEPQ